MATPTSNSTPVSSVPASGDPIIDSLNYLMKWGGGLGQPVTLTYSFPGTSATWSQSALFGYGSPSGDGEPWDRQYAPLTTVQQDAARAAMGTWSAVANITFTEVPDNASTVGEVRFAWTGGTWRDGSAHAYLPANYPVAGDVWLNANQLSEDFTPGTFEYLALVHELGHVIGFKHSFDTDGTGVALPTELDAYSYSIMSYSAYPGQDSWIPNFYPTTPMSVDIAAAQYLYGANMSYHAGNDVYTYNEGQHYWETIWDAGGVDTIVWNSGTDAAVIDLRPGAWSSIGEMIEFYSPSGQLMAEQPQTVNIYTSVVIENAVGGGGNDYLYGNSANNQLEGNAGADVMSGFEGNDLVYGGDGTDYLVGNQGFDVMIGGAGQDLMLGGAGRDRYVYLDPVESPLSMGDVIYGFNQGGDDVIDFSALSAGTLEFLGAQSFTGQAGQVNALTGDGGTLVQVDLNGDAAADMAIFLSKVTAVTANDFIL